MIQKFIDLNMIISPLYSGARIEAIHADWS